MALLLDHVLRVGELAGLQVTAIDLRAGNLRFYRPKVDVEQTHRLTSDTLGAGPPRPCPCATSRRPGSQTKGPSAEPLRARVGDRATAWSGWRPDRWSYPLSLAMVSPLSWPRRAVCTSAVVEPKLPLIRSDIGFCSHRRYRRQALHYLSPVIDR